MAFTARFSSPPPGRPSAGRATQSSRGVPAAGMEKRPIIRGVKNVWGESDVYAITTLFGDSRTLVLGQVLMGMQPDSPPDPSKRLVPVAWTKTYTGDAGKT